MSEELDLRSADLLRTLQEGLPLSTRPFRAIAERLGRTEEEVISGIRDMTESGTIRKLGAVLNPRRMGYVSVLAAASIPDENVEETAAVISEYRGVTHNYLREGDPNMWFTLIEPDLETLESHLTDIEKNIGVRVIRMPATKLFKIGVKLDI
ncbi:MAG: Lrp/AsnC family transcriptional regulator [Candidatus Thermoplasmatota archaeon]|nr:Lrp/AsnC family transcriptional regulator [Candidatus Thermoplasmatota archaeon]